MAYNSSYNNGYKKRQKVKYDRFNNPQVIIGLKGNPDFPSGFVELAGKLYKVTVSNSKKDDVHHWCTITKLDKRSAPQI